MNKLVLELSCAACGIAFSSERKVKYCKSDECLRTRRSVQYRKYVAKSSLGLGVSMLTEAVESVPTAALRSNAASSDASHAETSDARMSRSRQGSRLGRSTAAAIATASGRGSMALSTSRSIGSVCLSATTGAVACVARGLISG